jgi:hypothetical protein
MMGPLSLPIEIEHRVPEADLRPRGDDDHPPLSLFNEFGNESLSLSCRLYDPPLKTFDGIR